MNIILKWPLHSIQIKLEIKQTLPLIGIFKIHLGES